MVRPLIAEHVRRDESYLALIHECSHTRNGVITTHASVFVFTLLFRETGTVHHHHKPTHQHTIIHTTINELVPGRVVGIGWLQSVVAVHECWLQVMIMG